MIFNQLTSQTMEYDIDFFGSEQYFLTHDSVVWDTNIRIMN
jgi:hypothetical protein